MRNAAAFAAMLDIRSGNREGASVRHGVARICGEICNDAADLHGIRPNESDDRLQILDILDVRPDDPLDRDLFALDDGIQAQKLRTKVLAWPDGEQLLSQNRAVVGGGLNRAECFAERRVGIETLDAELNVTHDQSQKVVEVVGDSSRKTADAFEFLRFREAALEETLVGDVPADRGQSNAFAAHIPQDDCIPHEQAGRGASEAQSAFEVKLRSGFGKLLRQQRSPGVTLARLLDRPRASLGPSKGAVGSAMRREHRWRK